MSTSSGEEIFRSENLLVRAVAGRDQARWTVTFDHYSNEGGLERPGFGEHFLASEGLSAIHFICRDNDWFQYEETLAACEVARAFLSSSERTLAYGSSMGAYAAIRLADAVGADAVLALAPQYSIDPNKAPWEHRWQQDGSRINWIETIDGPIRCTPIPYIVFDPKTDDLRHVDSIEQDIPVARIPLPFSRHPVTTYLYDTGLLQPLFHAALDLDGDPVRLMRENRHRRKSSAFYLAELAREQPQFRFRTAIALAERSVALQPDAPLPLFGLAEVKSRAGLHAEAFDVYDRIMAITGRDASYVCPYADARYRAGDLTGAIALAEEVCAGFPGRAHLLNWHAAFLWESGARSKAIEIQQAAIELNPHPMYVEKLRAFQAGLEAQQKPRAHISWFSRLASYLSPKSGYAPAVGLDLDRFRLKQPKT